MSVVYKKAKFDGQIPAFSRTLNLKDKSDFNELVDLVSSDPGILKSRLVSMTDFKEGLQALSVLLPVPKIEMLMLDDVNINIGSSTLKLVLDQAVNLGLDLKKISSCKGFLEFSEKFKNPPQIQSTLTEARSAAFFVERLGSDNLKFIPEDSNKSYKTPEFMVCLGGRELYCECKRENPVSHNEKRKFDEWAKMIIKKTSDLIFPKGHRLEVELIHRFKRAKDKAIDDLVGSIKMSLLSGIMIGKTAEFRYWFIKKNVWPKAKTFPPLDMGHIRVRKFPVKFYPDHSWSEDMDYYLYTFRTGKPKSISKLINEAESQIPKDKEGIIIIETNDPVSARTAVERLAFEKKYNHVKGYWMKSNRGNFYAKKEDVQLFSCLNIPIERL